MMAFSSSRTLSYSTQVSRTRGRPNGSSTALYETRGKRRQKVFSQGMELAATACEQGNTTVLTITSDHLTGNFLPWVPHNGAGRPRIGLFHETNGWLSLFKCKAKPKSLVTRIEFLAKLGRPRVSSLSDGKLEISSARVQKLSVWHSLLRFERGGEAKRAG